MSRKDAGSKQEATASITRLTPWFLLMHPSSVQERTPQDLPLKIGMLTAASFLIPCLLTGVICG